MAKLTVADLQTMKLQGKKIAAAVVYEAQMARICERAGADILSVGDSVGRAFLDHPNPDDLTLEELLPFAHAVTRAAERAVVNVDLPTATCNAGPAAVSKAVRLLKDEVGADMTKVDIREHEEELFDIVRAVVDEGFAVYPQIGFAPAASKETSPAQHEHVLKWCHAAEDAGASIIDLTGVTPAVYADVAKSLRIPVIGGQTGPEADGRIYVTYSLVGYRVQALDNEAPSAARYIYDVVSEAFGNVHAGTWKAS